jgi:4-hydroxybenzoate polyprenyltransferase
VQSELPTPLDVKLRGVIRLTRWKEYVPFVIPVTLLGGLLATQVRDTLPDWRLGVTILANMLVVAYAFMINDIEDAPDDAREAARAARNPVACGELTVREGWGASLGIAAAAMILYLIAGVWPLIIGTGTLLLSHFYSWKPIRLKAWPITDVLSHSLMLSGLLFLAGYFTYSVEPGLAWLVGLALTLISSYGQLYNQIRDYDMDRAAGLHNTAIMVGKRGTQILMYTALTVAVALLLYTLIRQVIPLWIVLIPLLVAPVFYFVRPKGDMRGTAAVDLTGGMQIQVLILANVITVVWLIAAMLGLA